MHVRRKKDNARETLTALQALIQNEKKNKAKKMSLSTRNWVTAGLQKTTSEMGKRISVCHVNGGRS